MAAFRAMAREHRPCVPAELLIGRYSWAPVPSQSPSAGLCNFPRYASRRSGWSDCRLQLHAGSIRLLLGEGVRVAEADGGLAEASGDGEEPAGPMPLEGF